MPKVKRKTGAGTKANAHSKAGSRARSKAYTTVKDAKSEPLFFSELDTSTEGGFLSPWESCTFTVKDIEYHSAGQYILAEKARAFGDKRTLQAILEESSPEVLVSLGDKIKGVDDKSWRRRVGRVAKAANIHKFTSDDPESRGLLRQLQKVKNRELVFADPSDAILGIGYSEADAKAVDRKKWGANVFGKSLDAVRKYVKEKGIKAKDAKDTPFDPSVFDVGGKYSVWW